MNEESHPHYAAVMKGERAKNRARLIEECVEVMQQLIPEYGPNTFRSWMHSHSDAELTEALKNLHKERGRRCAMSEWSRKTPRE